MKYMIISDIHGDLQCLKQAMNRFEEEKADALLVLGDLLYRLLGWLPDETANLIVWGVVLAFSVAAVVLLVVKRRDIKAWLQKEQIVGPYAACYFTCAGTIAFLIVMGISTVITTRAMITPY